MGRPRLGERAMTPAERQRRYRARRAALRKASQDAPPPPGESRDPLGTDAAPLAIVQRAWARATAIERAEIAAWLTDDDRITARRRRRAAT